MGINRDDYQVRAIERSECEHHILNIHYAKRWPPISYEEYTGSVFELNRLCLTNNEPNEAGYLVGKSLRMLPQNIIIVSYADTSQGHLGSVYQATNFIYTGLSAKRSDYKLKGKEHIHTTTLTDEFRGQPSPIKLLREKYGDDLYLAPRPRKHRYVIIRGSKSFRKQVLEKLRYSQEKYPKKKPSLKTFVRKERGSVTLSVSEDDDDWGW